MGKITNYANKLASAGTSKKNGRAALDAITTTEVITPERRQSLEAIFKLGVSILLPLIIFFLPTEWIPLSGIDVVQQRVMAIFVMATLFWILEPVPIYATSVLIILALLLTVSDKSLAFLEATEGELLSYKAILGTFASPIIILFLGGFFLAIAGTKYGLDKNMARVLLKPFGTKPIYVMLGLMLITATFSMFMSNTATTVMMLTILSPVLASLPEKDKGKAGFVLAIPIAANVGGIGTPIGTPPNAIAMKYLVGEYAVSFGTWMFYAIPFVVILLTISWFLLQKLYPCKAKELRVDIKGTFDKSTKAIIVYATFATTILLWLFGDFVGLNSYVTAVIPIAVFSLTSVVTKEDFNKISWDVLWLVTGGIAMGLALEKTGLARTVVENIPFGTFSPYIIIAAAAVLAVTMANFMSNTATANLLMPMIVALAVSLDSLIPLGGVTAIVLCATFGASMGMSLPISTPPNALAHATGIIQTRDFLRTGFIIGTTGLLMTFVMVYSLNVLGWL
ncbi:SLC13 family permease [Algivirga pacifica]|uniref:SLC13 family permease n=1 Tax=Algivirga pacifica TaxID=1162670 RepID=A0ABP9D149_9BACT